MTTLTWINLGICCFNLHQKPFLDNRQNLIEYFNEISNLFLGVFIIAMSTLSSGEQIYKAGLMCNYYIIFMFMVNLIFVGVVAVENYTKERKLKKIRKLRMKRRALGLVTESTEESVEDEEQT